MARPRKDQALDLEQAQELTAGLIDRLACPPGRQQVFLRDTKAPGLRVRATAPSTRNPDGVKAFVFEAKLDRQNIRRTIGDVRSWTIPDARIEANRLRVSLDSGTDPREVERQQQMAKAAATAAAAAKTLTVGDVWPVYLLNGRPKRKAAWKPRYKADLTAMASPGGQPKKRGKGDTKPGPLHPLMAHPIGAVDEDVLAAWHSAEAAHGPHQAARALMMFRGFLRWCATRPEYRQLVNRQAANAPAIVENLPPTTRRVDCLEAAQLPGWFEGVSALDNRIAATYLQFLLMTGARREEVAALKWDQVDLRWKRLTVADKVDQERVIPLGSYLATLLRDIPRAGPFVFPSDSKSGHITDARSSHDKVKMHAGIEKLTFHGLRRSFSLLGEAAGAPAGAIAQIMGHKPSATAEGYRPRSIDALRPYMATIEQHILSIAGVGFAPEVPADLHAMI